MAQSDLQQQFRLRLSSGTVLSGGADSGRTAAGELLRPPTAGDCGNPRWLAPELCGRHDCFAMADEPLTESERLARLFGADSWSLGVIGWVRIWHGRHVFCVRPCGLVTASV